MVTAIYLIAGVAVLGVFYLVWQTGIKTYQRFRGKMLVTCPETHQTTGVALDAEHAALTAFQGEPDLRLKECMRWPERQNCGQECLAQIELSPENCLVRTMLAHWYQGRVCVFCGKPFQQVDSYDHHAVFLYDQKPVLLSPEGRLVEWLEVPVDTLPQVLTTYQPVCWNCFVAETFRRKYPELALYRPQKPSH